MAAPDTVTEAVAFLADQGYVEDLRLCHGGLESRDHDAPHPAGAAVVDHTFRFEGPSDPADEAIVLGVRCTEWGTKGVIVAAYGPDMEPEEAELLLELTRGRSGVTPPQEG
jgi:hypothetical protein